MKAALLPIHVWDREIDSRVLLALLLSAKGIPCILGDEYNIEPLYELAENAFLFKHGSIQLGRRGDWDAKIKSRGGFVVNENEEGVNNLPISISKAKTGDFCASFHQQSYPKITIPRKFFERTLQLAAGKFEAMQLGHNWISSASADILKEVVDPSSFFRFDYLGELGSAIYKDQRSALRRVFGNYVLILDNFSASSGYNQGEIRPEQAVPPGASEIEARLIIDSVLKTTDKRARVEMVRLVLD
jgi:hypothetical protein